MKPIVFFSHSSRDKILLNKLKKSILEKTNNAIDIFLSSDGQSIPFGKNWVYTIEKALKDASLMFVFLSPNSIQSSWIYFESGFSYSKNIEVIPIGILGIDLNQVKPPLNLLQGFNISSHNGLNNLIKTINDKFNLSCPLDYAVDDYNSLLIGSALADYISEDSMVNTVDYIRTSFPSKLGLKSQEIRSVFDQKKVIIHYFKVNSIPFRETSSELESHGIQILLDKGEKDPLRASYILLLDPVLFNKNTTHIIKIIKLLYENNLEKFWVYFFFKNEYDILNQDFKVSSRLLLPEIKLAPDAEKCYQFENILFAFDNYKPEYHGDNLNKPKKILRIIFPLSTHAEIPISKLINILFDQGIIYEK
jgi:hypothetical protein